MSDLTLFVAVALGMFLGLYIGWFMGYSARRDDEAKEIDSRVQTR